MNFPKNKKPRPKRDKTYLALTTHFKANTSGIEFFALTRHTFQPISDKPPVSAEPLAGEFRFIGE